MGRINKVCILSMNTPILYTTTRYVCNSSSDVCSSSVACLAAVAATRVRIPASESGMENGTLGIKRVFKTEPAGQLCEKYLWAEILGPTSSCLLGTAKNCALARDKWSPGARQPSRHLTPRQTNIFSLSPHKDESNSPGFYHLCVRQFMKFSPFQPYFCSFTIFSGIPKARWDGKKSMRERKEERRRPKKRELHELL